MNMKKKRISKLTIYTVLIILCVFTSIIFSNLIALLDEGNLDNANFVDDFGSNMNKENEKIEKNHDLSSLISPRDSAYYQTFGHSDDLMFSVDGAGEFTNTSVKDVFETDGSYYVTGHCINTSDNLRSLFLL